ncbi:MAG: hypothetical protein J6Y29_04565 [Clostridiales bacterium]|nr:hypothetical protein [Clostridiales bacterium]
MELVWLAYGRVATWSESSCVCGWFGGRSVRCKKRVLVVAINYIYINSCEIE